MSGPSDDPTPPEGVPAAIVDELRDASPRELRSAMIYAQELLLDRDDAGFPIEPAPGEEIISISEEDGYTKVVKKIPCGEDCPDCPHGPYLYHVTEETLPNGETELHWKFLGQVADETE